MVKKKKNYGTHDEAILNGTVCTIVKGSWDRIIAEMVSIIFVSSPFVIKIL